jgi:hypothetical protein
MPGRGYGETGFSFTEAIARGIKILSASHIS